MFLIIAKAMGWNFNLHKTLELRKDAPKPNLWNKKVLLYCSKDMKSFNRIPKEFQPLMKPLLGKVVCEFDCSNTLPLNFCDADFAIEDACVTRNEYHSYFWNVVGSISGWQISNLRVFDKPKDVTSYWKFNRELNKRFENDKDFCCYDGTDDWGEALTDCGEPKLENCYHCWSQWSNWCHKLTRPPQSWCYVFDGVS